MPRHRERRRQSGRFAPRRPPGFVQILDDETLLIPDRPGNNHLDSIENIIANPNVGLIFFVPGSEETLRVNGRARVVDDPSLLAAFELNGKAPKAGIEVSIGEVFLHCPKALKRSRLWDPSQHADRASHPYPGRLILEQTRQFAATQEFRGGRAARKGKSCAAATARRGAWMSSRVAFQA